MYYPVNLFFIVMELSFFLIGLKLKFYKVHDRYKNVYQVNCWKTYYKYSSSRTRASDKRFADPQFSETLHF
jgi:hypothetical protein